MKADEIISLIKEVLELVDEIISSQHPQGAFEAKDKLLGIIDKISTK